MEDDVTEQDDEETMKKGVEEDEKDKNLSEIDDDEIEQYILTHEESALKSIIWHHIHKEWLEEQDIKERKRNLKTSSGIRRKKKSKELVNAPDAVSAILNHSKIGNKLNSDALSRLFNDSLQKKLKVEGVKVNSGDEMKSEDERLDLKNFGSSRGAIIQVGAEEKGYMSREQSSADDLLSSLKFNFTKGA
jgi:transcription factor IIIB subunit 2